MFPYIDTSGWHVGPAPVSAFGILMSLGVAVSYAIAVRRGARDGITAEQTSELALWMAVAGLAGAHLATLIYYPQALAAMVHRPALILGFLGGVSSFGAFAGGPIGAALFFRRHRIGWSSRIQFLEPVAFAIPFGLSIARCGCYLAHDHPGIRTSSWLGVRYPGGTRYDLGLLEIFFLAGMSIAFLWLDRKPRIRGLFTGMFLISYGLFRISIDRLHVDPPRYLGFTVDQIASIAMITAGLVWIFGLHRSNICACFRNVTSAAGSSEIGSR